MAQSRAFGWHALVAIGVVDALPERTVVWVVRDDAGAFPIATSHRGGFDIEPEAGLLLLFTVAWVAMRSEDGSDIGCEIGCSRRFLGVRAGTQCKQTQRKQILREQTGRSNALG
jgi:hypothetical protein